VFTRIVDHVPDVARVVFHSVGEPMLVKSLPRMIRYLKDRGVYVLFNTNGSLLSPRQRQSQIDTDLDKLRVSLDAANATSFIAVRGKNFFDRIVRNVRQFAVLQRETGATRPRVSLWLTGLKETIVQLPAFVRLADAMGMREVHLRRLVFNDPGYGLAGAGPSLFDRTYFTGHGRALPGCIAPFSARGYATYTLGDATQQTLREIWNSTAYQQFRGELRSGKPPKSCANCGPRWSL
jgi:Iron-sulfur cluster-binding domain